VPSLLTIFSISGFLVSLEKNRPWFLFYCRKWDTKYVALQILLFVLVILTVVVVVVVVVVVAVAVVVVAVVVVFVVVVAVVVAAVAVVVASSVVVVAIVKVQTHWTRFDNATRFFDFH
jgi:hypothetical protein